VAGGKCLDSIPFVQVLVGACPTLTGLCVQMDIPQMSQLSAILYTGFFAAGATGMLVINYNWFKMLINRAKTMVDRVQRGDTPTPDYDRALKTQ
jgi:hypothetical protein